MAGWDLKGKVTSFLSLLLPFSSLSHFTGWTHSLAPAWSSEPGTTTGHCVMCCVGLLSAWSWGGVIQELVKEAGVGLSTV